MFNKFLSKNYKQIIAFLICWGMVNTMLDCSSDKRARHRWEQQVEIRDNKIDSLDGVIDSQSWKLKAASDSIKVLNVEIKSLQNQQEVMAGALEQSNQTASQLLKSNTNLTHKINN